MSDKKFSLSYWYEKKLVTPEEIWQKLNSFHLEGRKIKRLKFVGCCYNFSENWIGEVAYTNLKNLPENERQHKSDYENIDPDTLYNRSATIDEPFLMQFEDGDIFEIDTPMESNFCMGMNTIPWGAPADCNTPNIDANILFSECIGQTVTKVSIETYLTDKEPFYHEKFDEEPFLRDFVSVVVLHLENGLFLVISGFLDYCKIGCYVSEKEYSKIKFKDLKNGII